MSEMQQVLPHIRLQFNIEHANLEDCWGEGYQAASSEIDEEQNPFIKDSLEYEQWNEGWWAGFYGEEQIYATSASSQETSVEEMPVKAANEPFWHNATIYALAGRFIKISSAFAAASLIGYQLLDMVA